jgi:hypothetical protein
MIRSVRASGVVPYVLILNKELEVTTTEGGEPGKDAAIAFTVRAAGQSPVLMCRLEAVRRPGFLVRPRDGPSARKRRV